MRCTVLLTAVAASLSPRANEAFVPPPSTSSSPPTPICTVVGATAFGGRTFIDETCVPASSEEAGEGRKTLYDVLRSSPDATKAELKRSYVELAKGTHPDALIAFDQSNVESGVEGGFHEISRAWTVLSDDRERKRYDMSLEAAQIADGLENALGGAARLIESALGGATRLFGMLPLPFQEKQKDNKRGFIYKGVGGGERVAEAEAEALTVQVEMVQVAAAEREAEVALSAEMGAAELRALELIAAEMRSREMIVAASKEMSSVQARSHGDREWRRYDRRLKAARFTNSFESALSHAARQVGTIVSPVRDKEEAKAKEWS